MKRIIHISVVAAILAVGALSVPSNIDPTDKYGWGENIGWLNWRDANSTAEGVYVCASFLRGYIWAENVGWLNVGDGSGPYANTHDTNFGVNIDVSTNYLHGFAWAENIGWINFDGGASASPPNPAQYDPGAKRFRGFAWAENAGWINLDEAASPKFPAVKPIADCDCDGDVDGLDFLTFSTCYNGSLNPPRPGCPSLCADLDGDGDVDGNDFLSFSICYNGALNPPKCP